MRHLDEGTIHGWLDGALEAAEGRRIEDHIALCDECSALVAEARGLIAASSRILTALDDVPGGVIPEDRAVGSRQWAGALRAGGETATKSGALPLLVRHSGRWRAAAAIAVFVAGAGAMVILGSRAAASRRAMAGTDFAYAEPGLIVAEPVLVMAGELVMTDEMERRMENDARQNEPPRRTRSARGADVLAGAPLAVMPGEDKVAGAPGFAKAREDKVAGKTEPPADSVFALQSGQARPFAESAVGAALVVPRPNVLVEKDETPPSARRGDGAYIEQRGAARDRVAASADSSPLRESLQKPERAVETAAASLGRRARARAAAPRPLAGDNIQTQRLLIDDEMPPRRLEGLRLLSRYVVEESGSTRLRSLYEGEAGVIVTLDELGVSRASAEWLAQDSVQVPGDANAGARGKAAAAPRAPVNVLRWTDERGVEFTLSGPISIAELEELKKRMK